ncbi:phenylalanyl-tRNA synthetase subunit alpha [Campylobacter concisus]|uniref:Phenylalanyl-tRNA synthetase subunit alpha n=1 Tax=Campylobacter concisus TaxID=199 RepID=A0A1X0U1I5_9BACT|nr:phenylalanyl-tRNA synthetase subunit alpha [Campylobacter concisus]
MFLDKLGVDKSNWSELFSACVGKATLLQKRAFKLLVEGSNWQVDFDSGKIYFDGREFDMQFIGSESFSSNTWLWGYENINGFDERLLGLANKAREFGEKFGLSAFSRPQFELDENLNGHTISMILCTAFDEQNYYRIEYDGGAAYVAFRSDAVFEEPVLANELLSVVNECLSTYDLDHKILVKGLLLSCDMKFSESPNEIVANKNELSFKFDELNRLINISSKL